MGIAMGWVGGIPLVELKRFKISMSCFLLDIDSISKIFKNVQDQSQGFSTRVFSNIFDFWDSDISTNIIP